MSGTQRIYYLDAVRGLACLQVLFGHTLRTLVPAADFYANNFSVFAQLMLSPVFYLYDGSAAVNIFFCLSGFVLTRAFKHQLDQPMSALWSRLIRLGFPAVIIGLCSYALKFAIGDINLAAGDIIHSPALLTNWLPKSLNLLLFIKDTLINGLMIGYPPPDALPGPLKFLGREIIEAYNAPLWTLGTELQGSIIVFALVWARARNRILWIVLLAVLFWALGRSSFLCFLIGHVLVFLQPRLVALRLNVWLLASLVLAGIVLCASQVWWALEPFNSYCSVNLPFSLPCITQLQRMWGAIIIFIALIAGERFASKFEHWPLPLLGRLSFPLYLIHWPVLVGVGSLIFLNVIGAVGFAMASIVTVVSVCVIAIALAYLFIPVDDFAVTLSRRARGKKVEVN